jgi:ADP-ribose pyrophosphatase YjhB (NUDIX family)
VREVREEVGIDLGIDHLRFALVQQKTARDGEERVDFFFNASLPAGQQARIADRREVSDLAWVAPNCLPDPFAPYVLAAMDACRRSVGLSTWGFD